MQRAPPGDNDFMFNTLIQGKPTLWEREGWGARLGGEMLVAQEPSDVRAYVCDPAGMAVPPGAPRSVLRQRAAPARPAPACP